MREIAYKMQQNREQLRRMQSENRWRQVRQKNLMTLEANKIEQQLQCIKADQEPDPFEDMVVRFKRLEASDCLTEWEPGSLMKLLETVSGRTSPVGLELLNMALKFAGQNAIMELIERGQLLEALECWIGDQRYCNSAVNCVKQIVLKGGNFRNYILMKGMLQNVQSSKSMHIPQFYEAILSMPMEDTDRVQEILENMIAIVKKGTNINILKAINNVISWNEGQHINKLYELHYPELLLGQAEPTFEQLKCITWCWAYLIDWQPETPKFFKDNLEKFIKFFMKILKIRSVSEECQANQNRILFIIEQLFSDVTLSKQLSAQIEKGLISQLLSVLNKPINPESSHHVLRILSNLLNCTQIILRLVEVQQICTEILNKLNNYILQQPENLKMCLQILETMLDQNMIDGKQTEQILQTLKTICSIEGSLGVMAQQILSKV